MGDAIQLLAVGAPDADMESEVVATREDKLQLNFISCLMVT